MVREKWTDIFARYLTYLSHLVPILKETKRTVQNMSLEVMMDVKIFDKIKMDEEKRLVKRVRALSEFSAYYRGKVFENIKNFIYKYSEDLEPIDIKDYLIEFFDECISALQILMNVTNPDQKKLNSTYLYLLYKYLEDLLLPIGKNFEEIYMKLNKTSVNWYECQRYMMIPHTYYRETVDNPDFFEIPGISPKLYQIINNITSLYNLDPNYYPCPEDSNIEIPVILINDVFEAFIDNIAHEEQEAIEKICERLGLRVLDEIFLAPKYDFIDVLIKNDFLRENKQSDGKIRLIPQFSNETLILSYLAFVSLRRGFLSKELINWISMTFAFIIFSTILKCQLSDHNIFYPIFTSLKTQEKVIPYMMKLLCFNNYLKLDRMKIRDSVQYRKEIFNFAGSRIDCIKELILDLSEYLNKIRKKNKEGV